jgi:hypothetical protein
MLRFREHTQLRFSYRGLVASSREEEKEVVVVVG